MARPPALKFPILAVILALICAGCAQGGGGGEDSGGGGGDSGESAFPDVSELFPEQDPASPSPSQPVGPAIAQSGIGSCAAQAPPESDLANLSAQFEAFQQERSSSRVNTRIARENFTIPVYFHVIRKGPGIEDGNVPDSQLVAQVDALNRSFTFDVGGITSPFRFALGGINRVDKPEWFTLNPGTQEELDAKTALHTGGPDALNIYTANIDNNIVGFASFPLFYFLLAEIDGVVLQFKALPGGSFDRYNTGLVGVHEAGHWLGLLHTFQGECEGLFGDLVTDTPSEKLPVRGEACPVNRDSCMQAGLDPIHNHMTYTVDSCRTEFTRGQLELMIFNATFYRGFSIV